MSTVADSPAPKQILGCDRPVRLSVVVPVFNGEFQLSRCLEALRLSEHVDFEVIVVDDCSTDRTPQIVARSSACYLRTPGRQGPAAARNLGVEHARGEIIVFVDADVVVPQAALRVIGEEFARDPELAAMFGSYCDTPAWTGFLSQYKNLMHHYIHQVSSERAGTFWAGCGAIRKSVFEEFGGFNAGKYRHPSIEDIELGYRLTRAGRKIRLNRQIQVKHLKRWTLRDLLRADILHRAVPWTRLIIETHYLPRDLNLNDSSRASAALVGLLALLSLLWTLAAGGWVSWIPTKALYPVVASAVALLLALNWRVYAFFVRKRGWGFAAGAVIIHWFYYLYSLAVFVVCGVAHWIRLFFLDSGPSVAGSGPAPQKTQSS